VILCHQHPKLVILRRRRRTCFRSRSCFCRCISSCHPRRGSAFGSRYRKAGSPRLQPWVSLGLSVPNSKPDFGPWGTGFVDVDNFGLNLPSRLCEVPLARSDSEIRLVDLDLNPVVLVRPCVTRNVKGDLILEELTLFIAPSVGPITSRIDMIGNLYLLRAGDGPKTRRVGAIGNLYLLRAYSDGPKRRDGLRQVVVENLEVLLLKIGDALSGCRRNYDIQANASRNWTAFGRGILTKRCRNTKHNPRQNRKYTVVDEHKVTPTYVIHSQWTQCPVSNCMPDHTPGSVSSRHLRAIAQGAIQLPIHTQHIDTHDKINSDTKQSGASRTEPFNAAL
jgi:hypothetical protein